MSKFTPGPWKILGQNIIGNELNGFICSWSGSIANARLIAAAPELHATVLDLIEVHGGAHTEDCPEDDTCDCAWKPFNDKIQALLDKIDGKS